MSDRSGGGAFSASHNAQVGRYTYEPDRDHWWWSDEMYRIHGFEPGDVVPTTELVMSHIRAEDRGPAWDSREGAVERGEPFSFLHRIVTAKQRERVVIAAGHAEQRDRALVIAGHLVDITDVRRDAVDAELDEAVSDFAEHRAVIEQAKGVLVQLYSVDPETAWALLRAFSSDSNRKIRDIASALVAAAEVRETPTRGKSPSPEAMLRRLYGEAVK
ncbi:PAS and ANTAR domain-containing protein [Nocardioides KLBMP 9356]|uniref:PAS and ANTAR domain-containing protein n=1 Tax=Nocardioides potassii TaxID=2911371 RepID=A0ABS9H7P5_9ACTN|nr:PAS and ANTAR domain-containing protein [Nocardioides potassii]MCF6376333.1 PAS and ANTAR domain-containing protein [Nocardioides potassii]